MLLEILPINNEQEEQTWWFHNNIVWTHKDCNEAKSKADGTKLFIKFVRDYFQIFRRQLGGI